MSLDCKLCGLYEQAKTICLQGTGPKNARIMLVGEAPGYKEDTFGKPFIGKAGELLDFILAEVGVKRSEVYIDNAVKCRPPDNRQPTAGEIKACRGYLLKAITAIKPEVVIALGRVALTSLVAQTQSIELARGKRLKVPEFRDIVVRATYHPAATFRRNYLLKFLLEDIKSYTDNIESKKKRVTIEPLDNFFFRAGYEEPILALSVDVETTSLDFMNSRILIIGTCWESDKAWMINPKEIEDTNFLQRMLLDPIVTKIGHNIKFDLEHIRASTEFSFAFRGPIFDTLIAAHLLEENYPAKDLKSLALIHTNLGDYSKKLQKYSNKGKTMADVPEDILWDYCGKDSIASFQLYKKFKPQLEEQKLMAIFNMLMEAEKAFVEIEMSGCHIDKDKLERTIQKYEQTIGEYGIYFQQAYPGLNPNSSKQLREILFGKLHLRPIKQTTKGKKPSTDEETLNALSENSFVKKLIKWRKMQKIYNTYLIRLRDLRKGTEYVHPSFKFHGTVTGRLSCNNPNFQNMPKGQLIRGLFNSRFSEGQVIEVDYSQLELRIAAWVSGDTEFRRVFEEGQDIHRRVASECFSVGLNQVTEQQRQDAKAISFGILYGVGPWHLAKLIGCSSYEATEYIQEFLSRFPRLRRWIREIKTQALKSGIITNPFGRRRRFLILNEDSPEGKESLREAVNFPIQSTASDITLLSLTRLFVRLKKGGFEAKIIGSVHDSVIVDCPEKEVRRVIKLCDMIFNNPNLSEFGIECPVPLLAEIKIGDNWGNVK